MKTLTFVLLAATVLVSCKKSEEPVAEPPLTSPGLVAKLNGTAVNYSMPSIEKQVSTDGTETVFISAFTTEGNSIELSVSKQNGIVNGEYDATKAAHIGVSDGPEYYSTNQVVKITITSVDATHIVGTFTGEAINTTTTGGAPKTVSGGKFYVNF